MEVSRPFLLSTLSRRPMKLDIDHNFCLPTITYKICVRVTPFPFSKDMLPPWKSPCCSARVPLLHCSTPCSCSDEDGNFTTSQSWLHTPFQRRERANERSGWQHHANAERGWKHSGRTRGVPILEWRQEETRRRKVFACPLYPMASEKAVHLRSNFM